MVKMSYVAKANNRKVEYNLIKRDLERLKQ